MSHGTYTLFVIRSLLPECQQTTFDRVLNGQRFASQAAAERQIGDTYQALYPDVPPDMERRFRIAECRVVPIVRHTS